MANSSWFESTDPYWLKYPTLSRWQQNILASGLFIAIIFGIFGNSAVIYIYSKCPKTRKRRFFAIVLSVMGTCCNILYIPGVVKLLTGETEFNFMECFFHGFMVGWFAITCIILLSVIAMERCFIVCMPFVARQLTMYTKLMITLGALVYSLIISSPPLIGWSRFSPIGHRWSCSFAFVTQDYETFSYLLFMIITGFIFPCTIILVSYLLILKEVCSLETRKRHYKRHSQSQKGDTLVRSAVVPNGFRVDAVTYADKDLESESEIASTCAAQVPVMRATMVVLANGSSSCPTNPTPIRVIPQLRMTLLMLTVIIAFLISWTPFCVIVIIAQFSPDTIKPMHVTVSLVLAKLFTLWNPIIYGFKEKLFRTQCKLTIKKICACNTIKKSSLSDSEDIKKTHKVVKDESNMERFVGCF